jgi:pimeloyl-ACP methyl ester carboxylesterase
MQRRVALKSALAALTGGVAMLASARRAEASVKPPFVTTRDGTRLFVRDWGTGRPVVFVAPWALCADWWDVHMTTLAGRGLRCIAYDRRGHARSDEPGGGYDFDTLADDLATVIERRDLQNVLLVGHSMGGCEVVRYLTRHRSRRVTRVVLIAPVTPFTLKTDTNPDGAPREALERGREGLTRDLHRRIAEAAPAFFGAPANPVSAQAMEWWTRMMVDRCSLKVMLDLHRIMTETDFRPELPTITVPTLILHGDRDVSARLDFTGRRTQQLIPRSELKVYEGAAHGLPFTHAEQFQADLLALAAQ